MQTREMDQPTAPLRSRLGAGRFCLLAALCLSPAALAQTKTPKPAAKNVVKPVEIPKGAIKDADGTYRYTDAKGKKWIYRKTPFGISRAEGKAVEDPKVEDLKKDENLRLIDATTAVEEGDNIRFERSGPFGVAKWERKKTELNEVEHAVWDRELQKRAARENSISAVKD